MEIKTIVQIVESTKFNGNAKNEVFKGMHILSKYCDNLNVTAEHDQIWVYGKDDELHSKITKVDVEMMADLNWWFDEDNEGWSKFV